MVITLTHPHDGDTAERYIVRGAAATLLDYALDPEFGPVKFHNLTAAQFRRIRKRARSIGLDLTTD